MSRSRLHTERSAVRPAIRFSNHNLPAQLTSFVGREQEIAEVKKALPRTRALTLTGAGGCGKTRLALLVAADSIESYSDGVWLVELAPISAPELVPAAVASALSIPEQPGKPLAETLRDSLRAQRLLLVLDNCEHVLSGAAELTMDLLQSGPNLTVLATSRESLGIPGEAVWRVPPLSVPDARDFAAPERLMSCEAVRLFVERAAFSEREFTLTKDNAPMVARICTLLDGIPLAIEFAAARVKVLSVEQIAVRLDDRFQLLAGGGRSTLVHHQTLRAAMDWSYDLLSESERVLLRRLSVFAGGWTLEAAESVCAGESVEAAEVLDLLTSLVDKSLVLPETQRGEARYRLLETIRQYARDRLLQAGEDAEFRTRHRTWYLEMAERAEARIRGPEETLWLDRLEAEHDNLRAALAWSTTEEGEAGIRLRLVAALWMLWDIHTHWDEGRRWLEAALTQSREIKSTVRVKALRGEGLLAYRQRDYKTAMARHEESLALARELGDQTGIARALTWRGNVFIQQGHLDAATAMYEESLQLSRSLGDGYWVAMILAEMGAVAQRQGDYTRAVALCDESLAMCRALCGKQHVAWALGQTAHAVRLQGDLKRAAALYKESLAMFGESKDKLVATRCLGGLGLVAGARGLPEGATRLFGAAEAIRERFGITAARPPAGDQERFWAAIRERPEETPFAAAWAEGRAMTLEQAIEYALTVRPEEGVATGGETSPTSTVGKDVNPLTLREREIAVLIARGMSNRDIASHLGVAKRTVETHVQNILNKLNVNSRAAVAAWTVEHGHHSVR